ncbi:MAG: hypothetical protein KatS3mg121_0524 [Gammaproteobacteria bacterium]|nr:MAG: hypothetical protein KatS3mg121_0524 [Gammaproteobacteria bacterium]
MSDSRRIYVLDTSVLLHDPAALFRFHEHDLYLPMAVLEALDRCKTGLSETAQNARQVNRFLDELIARHPGELDEGLPLAGGFTPRDEPRPGGRLFFQTGAAPPPGEQGILQAALALRRNRPAQAVILVTKDINLRVKARALGLAAEDYASDRVLEDLSLLPEGLLALPAGFWSRPGHRLERLEGGARARYRATTPAARDWHPGLGLWAEDDPGFAAIVRRCGDDGAELEALVDYGEGGDAVWGVHARNRAQNFALNVLMDPQIDLAILLGNAGTGKTLLSLAAGLAQTLDAPRYREIVITRITLPLGEDIGFLPGTEEEKMTPWMGAVLDNLEVLGNGHEDEWAREATQSLLSRRIKVRSMNFMRGRTFLDRFLIVDEAQNLTAKQIKALITRAGPGTKVVCLGNIAQIDTPYLTETTSGLTHLVQRFLRWPHSAHVVLQRGERSRLADHAAEVL